MTESAPTPGQAALEALAALLAEIFDDIEHLMQAPGYIDRGMLGRYREDVAAHLKRAAAEPQPAPEPYRQAMHDIASALLDTSRAYAERYDAALAIMEPLDLSAPKPKAA